MNFFKLAIMHRKKMFNSSTVQEGKTNTIPPLSN